MLANCNQLWLNDNAAVTGVTPTLNKFVTKSNTMYKALFSSLFFVSFGFAGFAQYTPPDGTALEGIIVETYYVSDSLDVTDTDGGTLDYCSVTYRVFVDLKPGYRMQAVYGNERNPMRIEVDGELFNNEDRGEQTGDAIGANFVDNNTVALDSWVTVGSATDSHWGIPKNLDTDGSIVGGENNDGGSEAIAEGLLANAADYVGIPLTEADGLLEGDVPTVTTIGIDLGLFGDENAEGVFETTSGAWSVLEGAVGPTDDNIILLGQFTTSGTLSVRMNIQIGIPAELQCPHPDCHNVIQYVAELHPDDAVPSVANDNKFEAPGLLFTREPIECTIVGVEEVAAAEGALELFPNPASDQLSVRMNGFETGTVQIAVLNTLGQTLLETNTVSNGRGTLANVSVDALATGTYFVRAVQGDRQVVKTFLKH